MKQLNYDGEKVAIIDAEVPQLRDGEVIIEPTLMGICSTDLELVKGYMDFTGTLGHEFVGKVVAGDENSIGKRVAGSINISCYACDMCARGIHSQCRNRRTLGIFNYDGAFSEQFRLPAVNLHAVPDNVSDEQAVFTEPLAAACQILEQIEITPNDRVLVVGIGRLGMLVSQVMKTTGADLAGVIRHDHQRKLLNQWGIDSVTTDEIPYQQADIVIEVTGNEHGFADALNWVKPRGTVVLKSTYTDLPKANLTKAVVDEITLIGSRCGPFDKALNLLSDGVVDPLPLIVDRYPLSEGVQALEHASQRGVLKILLET